MKVILFGGTGMVGQGVLRECVLDDEVREIVSIVRRASGSSPSAKVREVVHDDFFDFTPIEAELRDADACFFSLGATSAGKSQEEYRRITYDITVAAADALLRVAPRLTFVFISGAGSDSSERGRVMWARVKGAAENALLRMPFGAVYVIRPAFIQPLHGIESRTALYRILYRFIAPLTPIVRRLLPQYFTTTEQLGRAMLQVAKRGAPRKILESRDINAIAAATSVS